MSEGKRASRKRAPERPSGRARKPASGRPSARVRKPAPAAKPAEPPADPDLLLSLETPSEERAILPCADRAVAATLEAGFATPLSAPRLKLALVELITNAMEHGNLFDRERKVVLRVRRLEGDRLEILVRDAGSGPPPDRLARDLEEVGLESKRGRGLGLVKRILGAPAERGERPGEVVIRFERGRFT